MTMALETPAEGDDSVRPRAARSGQSRGARRLRAIVLAVLTTIGFAASGAATAQAARVDVCPAWGCGSATFSWARTDLLSPLSLSYRDTSCDGKTVYFNLRMKYSGDDKYHLTPLKTAGGCRDGYKVTNTSWDATGVIDWVQPVLWLNIGHSDVKAVCGTRITRGGTKTGSPNGTC